MFSWITSSLWSLSTSPINQICVIQFFSPPLLVKGLGQILADSMFSSFSTFRTKYRSFDSIKPNHCKCWIAEAMTTKKCPYSWNMWQVWNEKKKLYSNFLRETIKKVVSYVTKINLPILTVCVEIPDFFWHSDLTWNQF